jgi:hypothetical protein
MRTLSFWRPALLAFSILTLASTALAGKPATKPDHPSTHQTQGKHVKRKTATAPKARASASERVRRATKQTAKPAAAPARQAAPAKGAKAKTVPSNASSSKHGRTARRMETAPARKAAAAKTPTVCLHEPVTIVRGADDHAESIVLTRCNGRPADGALQKFSNLLVPSLANPARPARAGGAPVLKTLDVGLMNRMQAIATRFPGHPIRIASSLRPMSGRSYHQSGRAVDMLVNGVSNETLVAFCRTLPDTGCGYYPNSTFVHVDVRSPGTGHVYWIDASRPGEPARYVTSWPEKTDGAENASAPAGLHEEHEETQPETKAQPPAPRQPLTGDLELDSKQEESKAR